MTGWWTRSLGSSASNLRKYYAMDKQASSCNQGIQEPRRGIAKMN